MSCEPLRGKKVIRRFWTFFETEDVASAVKFYKKYNSLSSWNPTGRLEKEHPEIYKIYNESDMSAHPSNYDKWLFDYCFADVIVNPC